MHEEEKGDRKRKERKREKEKEENERRNYHVTTSLQIIKKQLTRIHIWPEKG